MAQYEETPEVNENDVTAKAKVSSPRKDKLYKQIISSQQTEGVATTPESTAPQSEKGSSKGGVDVSAGLICTAFTVMMAIAVIAGLASSKPLIPILFLIPVAIYELIRTEEVSTKGTSAIILAALIVEVGVLVANINFDLAGFIKMKTFYYQGASIPLGELKTVLPLAMAIASVLLFRKAGGVYTRWLAGILAGTSLILVYAVDPVLFGNLIGALIRTVMWRVGSYMY